MNIENKLKKDGIEIIAPLDCTKINSLAKSIAQELYKTFPELKLNYEILYDKLSSLSMYYVSIPNGMSEANYLYTNSTLYFKYDLDEKNLKKFATHECIHYLQTVKDHKNHLLKLGLCDLTGYKIYGLALNEAAVQYMSAKLLNEVTDTVKYYGISFSTTSPLVYPLLCSLIEQMAFVTSEYNLFTSTFFSTNSFQEKFAELCGEKIYKKIESNFDIIFYAEEKIIRLSNFLLTNNTKKEKKINNYIENLKKTIRKTFIETQTLIYTSYFNNEFNSLFNKDSIINFRKRLHEFKQYVGIIDNYNSFESFYLEMMIKLDEKDNLLQDCTYLTTIKEKNKLYLLLIKLKNLLLKKHQRNEI